MLLQVERFLWHALPTAAVALQREADHLSSSSSSISSSSAKSGSTATSGSYSRFPTLPRGSTYDLQLGSDGAASTIEIIAPVMLQLASGDVPEQQQLDLVAAGTWLRLRGTDITAEEEEEGAEALQQDGRSTEQQQTSPGLAQAGYLWWSSTQVQAHSSSTVSTTTTTSSSSSSSSASAGGAVTSSASQSNPATTHFETPPSAHSSSSSSSSSSSGGSSRKGTQAPKHVHPSASGAGAAGPYPARNRAPGRAYAEDPAASTDTKLQVLAAAAAAQLCDIMQYGLEPSDEVYSVKDPEYKGACTTLSQLLLLVVQELQGASPQQRTAFLHSPAGGTVLRVLTDLLCQEGISMHVAGVVAGLGLQVPVGGHQQQQQQVPGGLQASNMNALSLVEQLLLPGLLLQPAPAAELRDSDAGGCSSSSISSLTATSSSSSSHSSGGFECMSQPNAGAITATCGSSKRVVMTLGEGEVTWCVQSVAVLWDVANMVGGGGKCCWQCCLTMSTSHHMGQLHSVSPPSTHSVLVSGMPYSVKTYARMVAQHWNAMPLIPASASWQHMGAGTLEVSRML
jgi:hypothetical protein